MLLPFFSFSAANKQHTPTELTLLPILIRSCSPSSSSNPKSSPRALAIPALPFKLRRSGKEGRCGSKPPPSQTLNQPSIWNQRAIEDITADKYSNFRDDPGNYSGGIPLDGYKCSDVLQHSPFKHETCKSAAIGAFRCGGGSQAAGGVKPGNGREHGGGKSKCLRCTKMQGFLMEDEKEEDNVCGGLFELESLICLAIRLRVNRDLALNG
ncbi:hypothetical protein MRB53_015575 [Persea americana]|uniref:Uncharacterized protein n=1 Tax=Persea americana TaxID=3435 RepID=A0ACC2LZV2_PERAE|nr:hypothetical protein MRB53_015575 [Persea americana]